MNLNSSFGLLGLGISLDLVVTSLGYVTGLGITKTLTTEDQAKDAVAWSIWRDLPIVDARENNSSLHFIKWTGK